MSEKQTHVTWLTEAARAYYIEHCHNGKDFPNFPVEKSLTMRAFIAGHDAALRSPVVRAMAEALDAAEDALRLIYHRHSDDMRTAKLASNNAEKVRLALAEFAAMGGE